MVHKQDQIGKRIKQLRKDKGWTLKELSEKLNELKNYVSAAAIQKWENDEALPNTLNLIGLRDVFGTTLEFLIDGKGDAPILSKDKPKLKGLNNKDIFNYFDRAFFLIDNLCSLIISKCDDYNDYLLKRLESKSQEIEDVINNLINTEIGPFIDELDRKLIEIEVSHLQIFYLKNWKKATFISINEKAIIDDIEKLFEDSWWITKTLVFFMRNMQTYVFGFIKKIIPSKVFCQEFLNLTKNTNDLYIGIKDRPNIKKWMLKYHK